MTYVYEDDSGEQHEADFPIGQAPDSLVIHGRRCRKIIVGVSVIGQPRPATESESRMLMGHRQYIEANADAVRDGRLDVRPGKHTDHAHRPVIPNRYH